MLFKVSYAGYVDFFTAVDFSDAVRKAEILACNESYGLEIIQS